MPGGEGMDHLTDAPIANILILAGIIFLAVGLFGRIGGFIGSIFGNIEAGNNSRVLAGVLGVLLIVGGGWLHQEGDKTAGSRATTTPNPAGPVANVIPVPAPPPSPAGPASSTAGQPPAKADIAPAAKAKVPKSQPSAKVPAAEKAVAPATAEASVLAADREKLPAPSATPVGDDRLVGKWTNLTPRADGIRRFEIVRDGRGMDLHLWYACTSGDCDVGVFRLDFSGSAPMYEFSDSHRRRVTYLILQTGNVLHVRIDLFENGAWYKRNHWLFTKSTISESMRSAFSRYLAARGEKAFAVAPGGVWSYHIRGNSASGAAQTALQHCAQRAVQGCRVILLNDDAAE